MLVLLFFRGFHFCNADQNQGSLKKRSLNSVLCLSKSFTVGMYKNMTEDKKMHKIKLVFSPGSGTATNRSVHKYDGEEHSSSDVEHC